MNDEDIRLLIAIPFLFVGILLFKVWLAMMLAEIISPYFKWEK